MVVCFNTHSKTKKTLKPISSSTLSLSQSPSSFSNLNQLSDSIQMNELKLSRSEPPTIKNGSYRSWLVLFSAFILLMNHFSSTCSVSAAPESLLRPIAEEVPSFFGTVVHPLRPKRLNPSLEENNSVRHRSSELDRTFRPTVIERDVFVDESASRSAIQPAVPKYIHTFPIETNTFALNLLVNEGNFPIYVQPYVMRAIEYPPFGFAISHAEEKVMGDPVNGDPDRAKYYLAPFITALGLSSVEVSSIPPYQVDVRICVKNFKI